MKSIVASLVLILSGAACAHGQTQTPTVPATCTGPCQERVARKTVLACLTVPAAAKINAYLRSTEGDPEMVGVMKRLHQIQARYTGGLEQTASLLNQQMRTFPNDRVFLGESHGRMAAYMCAQKEIDDGQRSQMEREYIRAQGALEHFAAQLRSSANYRDYIEQIDAPQPTSSVACPLAGCAP